MKIWIIGLGAVVVAGVTCAIVLPITLSKPNQDSQIVYSESIPLGDKLQEELDSTYLKYEEKMTALSEDCIEKDNVYVSKDASISSTTGHLVYYYSCNSGYWEQYQSYTIELTKACEDNLFENYYIYRQVV